MTEAPEQLTSADHPWAVHVHDPLTGSVDTPTTGTETTGTETAGDETSDAATADTAFVPAVDATALPSTRPAPALIGSGSSGRTTPRWGLPRVLATVATVLGVIGGGVTITVNLTDNPPVQNPFVSPAPAGPGDPDPVIPGADQLVPSAPTNLPGGPGPSGPGPAGPGIPSYAPTDGNGGTPADPVTPQPANLPTANLVVTPTTGGAPLAVTVDGSGSTPGTSLIDLGQAGVAAVSGPRATHTYDKPGTYQVTLQVTNEVGMIDRRTVTVTVTAPPPILLQQFAGEARWTNGFGSAPFPGPIDDRGGAHVTAAGQERLEDGTAPSFLAMNPQVRYFGWLNGDFTLPRPLVAGERFRSRIGFVAAPPGDTANPGDGIFTLVARLPDGSYSGPLVRQHDVRRDGLMLDVDVDLSSVLSATALVLGVEGGDVTDQDFAVWVNPRVESR